MPDVPKIHRRHGFYVLVMVVGWVLPPIAVLLRFGFGKDFCLNILLTLCGYIPGHGHNFYLQNIRNNQNRKRTPQWATRAGLVKDHSIKRKAQTQWANRYDERTPTRADGYQDEDVESQQPRERSTLLEPERFIDPSSTSDDHSTHHSLDRSHSQRSSLAHRPNGSSEGHSNRASRQTSRLSRQQSQARSSRSHHHSSSESKIYPDRLDSDRRSSHSSSTQKWPGRNQSVDIKGSRRKTQPVLPGLDLTRGDENLDDGSDYFVRRRASSINGSFSNAKSPASPTSAKSFSQKFGFGSKKNEKRNRFDISNEARAEWENLPNPTHAIGYPNHLDATDDGLNHQF